MSVDLDETSELPVLTEDAILEFEALAESSAVADGLAEAVEALRATLESAEDRWSTLEGRIESQNRVIGELQQAFDLLQLDGAVSSPDTEPPSESDEEPPPETREDPPTGAGENAPEAAAVAEHELLERIATLEAYIAGRADRWRTMEKELEAKTQRIAELETELEQRIVREQSLEEQLFDETSRVREFRAKVNELSARLAAARNASLRSLDRGQQARPSFAPPILDIGDATNGSGIAELVCLSSRRPERHVLDKTTITIGRGPECDIQVATHFVSRAHACIRRDNGSLIIEDRSSTNGVFVNARRIERHALEHGDWITIGESQFRFLNSDQLN